VSLWWGRVVLHVADNQGRRRYRVYQGVREYGEKGLGGRLEEYELIWSME